MIHLHLVDYLVVCPFIFLAGVIDSIAGGGGVISLPTYLSVGLPPHLALGTNKFSSCCGTLIATGNYYRNTMIDVKVALTSALGALIGAWLGTKLVLLLSPTFLNYLLAGLIPVIAVIVFINQKLGAINLSHVYGGPRKLLLGFLAGLIIGCYDGFFGPGTGTWLILFYTIMLKYDFVMANGNCKVVNLASNIASLLTFIVSGKVLFALAIPAAICGTTGNYIGSKLVVLKGNKLIRPIFILALTLLMLRVLYNIIRK